MSKNILIFTVTLLLGVTGFIGVTACTGKTNSNVGVDGYTFVRKQYENKEVSVSVVTYTDIAQLDKVASSYLNNSSNSVDHTVDSTDVVAFSVLEPNHEHCTIHMMDPSVTYKPEFIGHEFTHCLYGQFHDNNLTH